MAAVSRLGLLLMAWGAWGQPWSAFLDPSRAIDWSGTPGFSIPNYTVNCVTQPTLATGPAAASANTTSIQAALNSCDATHNVVLIPAGTWYVAGITFGTQGSQVLRGAGPNSTYLYLTVAVPCGGFNGAVCMISPDETYAGDASVLPPSGTRQCLWTGGLTKGSTSITLSSCGGAPPVNKTIILDQANDTSDTGGIYICDSTVANCTGENSSMSLVGRSISGIHHAQVQVTYVTAVTSLGGGSYTVTISPGVYFNNVRAAQAPGAWWAGFASNMGLENLTIDRTGFYTAGSSDGSGNLAMVSVYNCWEKNVRSMFGGRNHTWVYQSAGSIIRDSYFYQNQSHAAASYGIDIELSSNLLVENNIFQQVTFGPTMFGPGSGVVIGYNYVVNNGFAPPNFDPGMASHNAGNGMNLWESNNVPGIQSDDSWGGSSTGTWYRNLVPGWANGKTQYTYPQSIEGRNRAFNVVGSVLGQPGYQTTYEAYATSSTGGVNGGNTVNTTIYVLGWSGYNGWGGCLNNGGTTACDSLIRPTLMRWGNWDIVNAATQWNATEASPAAVPYVNANFTSTYFTSLAHTLPASLYYSTVPSWWPTGKPWPSTGPDVSGGNLGICSGTYTGAQASVSSQCSGGTLATAWAGHANTLPAQDCYLNVLHGPPDGTGGVLSYDYAACASAPARPSPPANLMVTVQ